MKNLVIENLSESRELVGASDLRDVSGGMKWTRGHSSADVQDLRPSGETVEVLGVEFYKTNEGYWLATP